MKKIKILFYSHVIDFAGTWRSHERILLNLDENLFDPYVFYNPNQNNNRLEYLKTKLDSNKIIPFEASLKKLGSEYGYPYEKNNFSELAKSYNFDIIHFARSGYFEWPFNQRICPIQVETNIFGFRDDSQFLDYSVSICNTINNRRGGSDKVIYNPIPKKNQSDETLISELKIPNNFFVFGRIGRKDNFHPIALDSIFELKKIRNDFKYIIIGACQQALKKINDLNLNDVCIVLDTTSDDDFIHKFYNTLDLFLHYRSDGECHSTAIAQAMSYGIPVISHSAGYNGQSETIKNGGFVVNNSKEYVEKINFLINDDKIYSEVSRNSLNRFEDFEEKKIIKEWEKVYINLYKKTK
jgi:glycosyltransferase involved in cell wall biosynthesis